MLTKKLGTYDLDIVDIKEFKTYYYENKSNFSGTSFNSYLKAVDIPPRFFKEQPEETQAELLDNREVFVASRKKYFDKVIIVLKTESKILNACRLASSDADLMYDKLKTISEIGNKFEHRSFYKDGYITYIVSSDMKNDKENNVLVVDFPILLNKPVVIHKATYSLPNDSSVVPVEHIHYITSEEIDLYVDYKDIKSAIEDRMDFLKINLEKEEENPILREVELVVLALIESQYIPKSYVEKVTNHIKNNLKGDLTTTKLEGFVLDFDEDLKSYKQVTSLRGVNGTSINNLLDSETFKKLVESIKENEECEE